MAMINRQPAATEADNESRVSVSTLEEGFCLFTYWLSKSFFYTEQICQLKFYIKIFENSW